MAVRLWADRGKLVAAVASAPDRATVIVSVRIGTPKMAGLRD
jgi:hypothetical protein